MDKIASPRQKPFRNLVFRSASAALFSLLLTPAFAADLALKYRRPPPPPIAPFSWTGLYLGINGGWGW